MVRNTSRWVFLAAALALLCVQAARADHEAGQTAWDAGRHVEAVKEWRAAADRGDAPAMLALGRALVKGIGIPQDFVEAHKWLNLAAARGNAGAATERDALSAEMTVQERAEARKLARDWRPGGQAAAAPTAAASAPSPAGAPPKRALVEAQKLLAALGYKPGTPDGVWGRRSIEAYRAFLKDSNLPPSEALTLEALRAMRNAAGNRGKSQPVKRAAKPAPNLHRIVRAGDIDGLKKALASTSVKVNARDARGWTPLMHAVNKGYTLLVPSLLKAGADPNLRLADGATALFMAVIHGQSKVVSALVKAGGDPTVRGPKGRTAEDLARASKNMVLIEAAGLIETIPFGQVGGQDMSHCIKIRDTDHERYRYDKSWSVFDTDWFTIFERHIRNACDEPVRVSYCIGHMNERDARLRGNLFSNSRKCVSGKRHNYLDLDPNEEKHARRQLRRRQDDLEKFIFGVCQKGYEPKRIVGTVKFNCQCDIRVGCPSIRQN